MQTFTLDIQDLRRGDFVPELSGHVVSVKESRRPGTNELRGYLVEVAELVGCNTTFMVPFDHKVTAVLGPVGWRNA